MYKELNHGVPAGSVFIVAQPLVITCIVIIIDNPVVSHWVKK
jgi:hypothetical protein